MHSADAAPSEQPPTSSPVKPSKRPPFKRAVLSFAGESDDSDDSDDSDGTHSNDNAIHRQRNVNVCPPKKRRRLGKDPDVDSSFLPDRDRELAEDKERERLKQDWLRKQDAIKNETVRITYSFWDGTGHRKLISCKKGTTIAHFLTIVQTQVKQLRNTTADSLMFIKEDLIIPHHYSFYDFIVSKARGVSLLHTFCLRSTHTVFSLISNYYGSFPNLCLPSSCRKAVLCLILTLLRMFDCWLMLAKKRKMHMPPKL